MVSDRTKLPGNSAKPSPVATLMVGVLQVERKPWSLIYALGQQPTWMSSIPDGVEVVNIFGLKPGLFTRFFDTAHEKLRWHRRSGRWLAEVDRALGRILKSQLPWAFELGSDHQTTLLRVKVPDCLFTLPIKEYAVFQYFLERSNAKYLYLTNTSSYVSLSRLIEQLDEFPPNQVYGGTMRGKRFPFASGANRIMSRDVVQVALDLFKEKWDFRYLDDLALGMLLQSKDLHHYEIPSKEIRTSEELDAISKTELKSIAHFRVKPTDTKYRRDWEMMRAIHERLTLQGLPLN